MLSIYTAKWGQTPETLRKEALNESHPRTRERLMALYEITHGATISRGCTLVVLVAYLVAGRIIQYLSKNISVMIYKLEV